ncbi:MAG: hypothetical protein KDI32_12685 [Pseudomonadales bacterium]|nr:hypothetical protein [Pseudomonadales bacterium]
MHRQITTVLLLALTLAAPLAGATNSPIELKTALADIMRELPGDYDNAGQVYFESETKATSGPPHDRVHLTITRVEAPAIGEHVLASTLRHGGKDGPIVDSESALWTLQVDPVTKAVRMTPFRSLKPIDSAPALTPADLGPAAGLCAVLWRKYGDALRGAVDAASCAGSPPREYVLSAEQLWVNHLPADPRRTEVGKPAGDSHFRLGKSRDFECLFSYQPPSAEAQISNGQHMRDRGDTLIWETAPPNQHKFEYELLRGMWPSNSGRNYTDLLRITMYELDPAKPGERKLLGVGWASAASDRASFGDGTYGGRCKLFDPNMPPPK